MFPNDTSDVPTLISSKVAEELSQLPPHLQRWARSHLVEPRLSRFSIDPDGSVHKDLWLVTDHTGEQDASYRIVYDGDEHTFGLECTLDSGVEWYLGNYGSFAEAVKNM
jgi:hypothetical protein